MSLRGHGDSEGYENLDSFGLQEYVSDVEQVVKSVEGDPVLVGHSMGGAIVQKYLLDHHQEIAGAVLLASPPPKISVISSLKPWLRNFRGMLTNLRLLIGKNVSLDQVYRSVFFDQRVPRPEVREYADQLQPESWQAAKDLIGRILPEGHGITAPVFVLGSKSDNLFVESEIKMTADAIDVEPVLLAKPCHDIMLDPLWKRSVSKSKSSS